MGTSMPAPADDNWRFSDVAVGGAGRLESTDRWTADPRIGGPAADDAPTGSMHDDDTAGAGSRGDRRGRTRGDRARSRQAVRRPAGAGWGGPRGPPPGGPPPP